jgi:small subunit ribosomal protein S19
MAKARRAKKVETRRKKEFTMRGRTLPELQAMSLAELSAVLTARARRSIRRGFTTEVQTFLEKLRTQPKEEVLKTHVRDALVLPSHVGHRVSVHNGREFKEFEIRPEMIGHYFGEFSLTRKFEKHSGPGVGATRSSKFMPLK